MEDNKENLDHNDSAKEHNISNETKKQLKNKEKTETAQGEKESLNSKTPVFVVDLSTIKSEEQKNINENEKALTKDEETATFDLGYFLGENSVPEEVSNLLNSLTGYTDELIAAKNENPSEIAPTQTNEDISNCNSIISESPHSKVVNDQLPPEKKEEMKQEFRTSLNPLSNLVKADKKVQKEKKKLSFGSSYDSATLNTAIGLIDMKSLCLAFA